MLYFLNIKSTQWAAGGVDLDLINEHIIYLAFILFGGNFLLPLPFRAQKENLSLQTKT